MHARATAAVARPTTQEAKVKTVTKKELVHRIAEQTGVTKVVAKDVIQSFLNAIIDELAEGNRLEFREFGVFESRERAARLAQNPRTLEKVPVPAKRIVKFKVGRLMRKKVSGEDVGDISMDDDDAPQPRAATSPPPGNPNPNSNEAQGHA
jgi:integration host factor subunit beta